MTVLVNDPEDFPAESLAGFADAFQAWVKPVYGGVVRSTKVEEGKVALIVGGGSGHYPAFAGWVGPGFADGAVAGNIFSSPSAAQVYSVAKAADRGAGVLIGFATTRATSCTSAKQSKGSEGIDARTLAVDDIASADPTSTSSAAASPATFPLQSRSRRRGDGLSIDEVEAVFNNVNERTRSFGVAFSGCPLPGAKEPCSPWTRA